VPNWISLLLRHEDLRTRLDAHCQSLLRFMLVIYCDKYLAYSCEYSSQHDFSSKLLNGLKNLGGVDVKNPKDEKTLLYKHAELCDDSSAPVIKILAEQKANVDLRANSVSSPLGSAICRVAGTKDTKQLANAVNVVSVLLESKANPNDEIRRGNRSPLLTAVASIPSDSKEKSECKVKLTSLLVKHGAKMEAKDGLSHTSLMYAAKLQDAELTKCLTDFQRTMRTRDDLSTPALASALHSKAGAKVVELLLAADANVTESDIEDCKDQPEIQALLKTAYQQQSRRCCSLFSFW
jgi:ankyrin repeat protein